MTMMSMSDGWALPLALAIAFADVLFFRFSLIASVIFYVNLADTNVYKFI